MDEIHYFWEDIEHDLIFYNNFNGSVRHEHIIRWLWVYWLLNVRKREQIHLTSYGRKWELL